MKILLVTSQLGSGYHSGTERYVENLGAGLAARGHDVHYLAGDPLGSRKSVLGESVGWGGRLLAYPVKGLHSIHGLARAEVATWLQDFGPDLVHLANPVHIGAGILSPCRTLGIPAVVTAMDYWWTCPRATLLREGREFCSGTPPWYDCARCVARDHPRPVFRVLSGLPQPLAVTPWLAMAAKSVEQGLPLRDLLRWPRRRSILTDLLRSAQRVIFPSKAMRDVLGPLLPRDRWQLIPYGLEERWFGEPKQRSPEARAPGKLRIGYAGSLSPHKGPELILQAVERLGWDDCQIRLAGRTDPPFFLRRLEELARDRDVEFTGVLDRDEMLTFMRSLDLLVVPSRWRENLPFVVLEAQAVGLPIIASRVPGIEERIEQPELLFEPGSVDDLARALVDFSNGDRSSAAPPVSRLEEMCTATEAVYAEARRELGAS